MGQLVGCKAVIMFSAVSKHSYNDFLAMRLHVDVLLPVLTRGFHSVQYVDYTEEPTHVICELQSLSVIKDFMLLKVLSLSQTLTVLGNWLIC